MELTPALWSAVAASFSALASFLMVLIHRRNLLEASRPELVLTEWERLPHSAGAPEKLHIATVRNVGRGVALNVSVRVLGDVSDPPTMIFSAHRVPVLAVGESTPVDFDLIMWWKNVPSAAHGHKYLLPRVCVSCVDARNVFHETTYSLLVVEQPETVGVTDAVAPGVMLTHRHTKSSAIWRRHFLAAPRRVLAWRPKWLVKRRAAKSITSGT